jgi:hypothetical protein
VVSLVGHWVEGVEPQADLSVGVELGVDLQVGEELVGNPLAMEEVEDQHTMAHLVEAPLEAGVL